MTQVETREENLKQYFCRKNKILFKNCKAEKKTFNFNALKSGFEYNSVENK